MGFTRGKPPFGYDPSTDGALAVWLDATDTATTSLQDTGGSAITNGATVGKWFSKVGTARVFQLAAAIARPTWNTSIINGKAAVLFNSQMLAADTVAGFNSLTGFAVVMAARKVAQVAGDGCGFGITVANDATISQVQLRMRDYFSVFCRRVNTDAGAQATDTGFLVPDNTNFIEGATIDYTNGKITLLANGMTWVRDQAVASSGSTSATAVNGVALGGFLQSGTILAIPCNGYIGELLIWLSYRTPDQLVAAHHYLRRRWGIN